MAINPNESWSNENAIIMAESGAGKGSMLRGYPNFIPPSKGGRYIIFDEAAAFPAYYLTDFSDFCRVLKKEVDIANRTGGGFAVGYKPDSATEDVVSRHSQWAKLVKRSLNGDYRTFVIDEELNTTSVPGSQGDVEARWLMTTGRKYGLIWLGTTQEPAQIPKVLISQSKYKYFGRVDRIDVGYLRRKNLCDDNGVLGSLVALDNGEFFINVKGVDGYKKDRYKYVEPDRRLLKTCPARLRIKGQVIRTR